MRKIIIAVGVLTLSGCASIMNKPTPSVAISSQVPGDRFTVTNRAGQVVAAGVTPGAVRLKTSAGYMRGERYTVTFGGAAPVSLQSEISGWYWAGLLGLEPIVGPLIVDPLTGAMFKLPEVAHGE